MHPVQLFDGLVTLLKFDDDFKFLTSLGFDIPVKFVPPLANLVFLKFRSSVCIHNGDRDIAELWHGVE